MFQEIKIIKHNGRQYIPNPTTVVLNPPFRGRPEISNVKVNTQELIDCCPTNAISGNPVQINLAKCCFCGECACRFPEKVKFTSDFKLASNRIENLIIREGDTERIKLDQNIISKTIKSYFGRSLKLRQVSAGGDNACEYELNACGNANFDMGRYGIEFVSSPRHADGLLVTGPITENMAEALQIAYEAVPEPKLFILCGVDAISGGIFSDSKALNRSFLKDIKIDLYIPGNPSHPLTVINGLYEFIR
jgi:Ni,Fe-hydrogenase III small subunit